MKDEIKSFLVQIKENDEWKEIYNCITNLQEELDYQRQAEIEYNEKHTKLMNKYKNLQEKNKIKDTNWESLKYYLEKLYYKDYIEEAISDDIDKKIKELESKVEIKGYQKDIKALQEENERLKELNENASKVCIAEHKYGVEKAEEARDYKSRNKKAVEYIKFTSNLKYENEYVGLFIKDVCNNLLNILGSDKDDK